MQTKGHLKRGLAVALALVMLMSVIPMSAMASFIDPAKLGSNTRLTSQTDYFVAPGITQTDITTHNNDGTNQVRSFALTVEAANLKNNTAGILASYKGYMNNLTDNPTWGMQTVRDQAAAAEKFYAQTGDNYDVVAGVNGDFFNMTTGAPTGSCVMNSKIYNVNAGWPYFAVLKDGTAVIRYGGSDLSDVAQAVGGPYVILKDGVMYTDSGYGVDQLPRTAVGIKEDGSVVFLVADGRQAPASCGQNFQQLAEEMRALGCVDALSLDGGGSATFTVQPEGSSGLVVANSPSDGSERTVASSILIYSNVTSDGAFDHATISPKNEVYTPGSCVEFTAKGIDASGASAELPTNGTLELADDSFGTITGNTFVSSGKCGTVVINYVVSGIARGSSSIVVALPDTLGFVNDELSLAFDQETDLGLLVKYQGRDVHYNDGDFEWTLNATTDGFTDADMGSFTGNIFKASDKNSVNGTVTVKSVFDASVTATANLVIGRQPAVMWDFEDADWYNFAEVECFADAGLWYYHGFESYALDSPEVLSYIANNNINMLFTSYAERSAYSGKAEVIDLDTGEVRFGNHALKLSFDFTTPITTEGASIGPVAATSSIEGSPTAIGCWVYAPEGTPNVWLRMRVKDGTGATQTLNFTEGCSMKNPGGKVGGIDWSGWKYVEASLEGKQGPFSFLGGETLRLMYVPGIQNGAWTMVGNEPKPVAQADCYGYIYIDNVQFVYGSNTDDTDNPIIDSVAIGDNSGTMTEITAGTVIESNEVVIEAKFHDVQNRNTTGIDYENKAYRIYVDGKNVTDSDKCKVLAGDETMKYYATLADGVHTVKILIRDGFGNETTTTRYFTVEGGVEYPTVRLSAPGSECLLNRDFILNLESNSADDVDSVSAEIKLDPTIVNASNLSLAFNGDFESDGWTYGETTGILSLKLKRKAGTPSTPSGEDAWKPMAEIKVRIPANVTMGKSFTYKVNEGSIVFNDPTVVTDTFASGDHAVVITAKYKIYADPVVLGDPLAYFHVTDEAGNTAVGVDVFRDDGTKLGKTNYLGFISVEGFSDATSKFTVYAMRDGDYSFRYTDQCFMPGGNSDGTPTYIIPLAVENAATAKKFGWIANPFASLPEAKIMYAEKSAYDADGETAMVTVDGKSTVYKYTGRADAAQNYAARINTVEITGLKENTEYVYKVGDGMTWSAVKTAHTDNSGAGTSFFVLGDVQTDDLSDFSGILDYIANDGKDYNFGIQIGDIVEDSSIYDLWTGVLECFAGEEISDIDIIHALGNHEYMGDGEGLSAALTFGYEGTVQDFYSVEYGNVYTAVLGYRSIASKESLAKVLQWLVDDAAKSDCLWKTVVIHTPPYNSNFDAPSANVTELLPAAVEQAGIDVVFSGHDHSYVRTYPLYENEIDYDNGTVYFISGSLGDKGYALTDNDKFAMGIDYTSYSAPYISVSTTDSEMDITVYDVAGGVASILDSYTITKDACVHDWSFSGGYLTCKKCTYRIPLGTFTGDVTYADTTMPMRFDNGVPLANRFLSSGSDVYYLGADGIPLTGEQTIDENKYTFGPDGKLNTVAFVNEDGTLLKDEWYSIGDDYYYLGEDGLPISGEKTIGKYTYTFGPDGKLTKGALVKEGNNYFYYIQGTKQRGWFNIEGDWYYFDRQRSLSMATGVRTVKNYGGEDYTYTFSADGKLVKGAFMKVDAGTFYYWANFERLTGWQVIDGELYYFDKTTSYMLTGKQTIDSVEYTFGEDGILIPDGSYVLIDGKYYNYTPSGKVAHITDHIAELVVTEAKKATCTQDGSTGGIVCKICNEVVKEDKVVKAIGHKWAGATCTAPDTCKNCGETRGEALGHNYVLNTALSTADYNIYNCSRCDSILKMHINPQPTEPTGVKGDADGDGKVKAADARIVLRVAAGLEPLTDRILSLCDFDGDGKIKAADARILLRLVAGLD